MNNTNDAFKTTRSALPADIITERPSAKVIEYIQHRYIIEELLVANIARLEKEIALMKERARLDCLPPLSAQRWKLLIQPKLRRVLVYLFPYKSSRREFMKAIYRKMKNLAYDL